MPTLPPLFFQHSLLSIRSGSNKNGLEDFDAFGVRGRGGRKGAVLGKSDHLRDIRRRSNGFSIQGVAISGGDFGCEINVSDDVLSNAGDAPILTLDREIVLWARSNCLSARWEAATARAR